MYYTEEEARKKKCPAYSTDDSYEYCISAECMAWRVGEVIAARTKNITKHKQPQCNKARPKSNPNPDLFDDDGNCYYCGVHYKCETLSKQYNKGFCGLAGDVKP